jgi:hypothetical protein
MTEVAKELVFNNNGEYHNNNTDPGLFSIPAFTINATTHVADAPGDLDLRVEGLLAGDTELDAANKVVRTKAVQADGGFMLVGPNSTFNPANEFTVEVWTRPEWDAADGPATRVLIDSRDIQGPMGDQFSGFAIWVNDAGIWEGLLGLSTLSTFLLVPGETAVLGEVAHLVLTLRSNQATLFVNGVASPAVDATGFVPNTTQPLTVGVGGARLAKRGPGVPEPAFPTLPFKGAIPGVAVDKIALDLETVSEHLDRGNTAPPAAP